MPPTPVFVAREHELDRLNGFLSKVLAGQSQVCFVTGEAGSGKTTLVTEFTRIAQEKNKNLLVAFGQSDAMTGIGDPYLPFREILGTLTGDTEKNLAKGAITKKNVKRLNGLLQFSVSMLIDYGPDLINLLVPGSGLITKVGLDIAENAGLMDKLKKKITIRKEPGAGESSGIKQEQIFEQYTNVLKAISKKQPLLLIVDDLHWVDTSSAELLFHLARRMEESRIMVLGTYRPDEVALGRKGERHPLEKVLAELKRYFGDICVELDTADESERRKFVTSFLETEPNRVSEKFKQALYHHTSGHPLFTVELLRTMQERGDLVKDSHGQWVEGPELNWDSFPPRVEGVIEERINRLEERQRRILSVASVEGESFTGEVVAEVQKAAMLELSQQLGGELEKKYRLVNAMGIQSLGSKRLSLFRFYHNLFQKYLYGSLSEVERVYLHEAIGNVLEELYADHANDIAEQLAWHFSEAGIKEKAAHYLFEAGKRAAAKFANAEALTYLSQALELTPEYDLARRFDILMVNDEVFSTMGQYQLQLQNLDRLNELAVINSDNQKIKVALRRARYYAYRDQYPDSIKNSELAISLAERIQDFKSMAWACSQLAFSYVSLGDFDKSLEFANKGLDISRQINYSLGEANNLFALGQGLVYSGKKGAQDYLDLALSIAHELNIPKLEKSIRSSLGTHFHNNSEYSRAIKEKEKAIAIEQQIGDRPGEGVSAGDLGTIYASLGDFVNAQDLFQKSLKICQEFSQNPVYKLINLSALSSEKGEFAAGYDYSQEALENASNNHFLQGYIYTCMGENLLGLGQLEKARVSFQQAVELRRNQEPASLKLEALAGLARVYSVQGDLSQAKICIEEIMNHLSTGTLDGAESPFTIYITCYKVLKTDHDPRTGNILVTAYNLLQEKAAKISDETFRHSFLKNIPAHRQIVSEWQAANQK